MSLDPNLDALMAEFFDTVHYSGDVPSWEDAPELGEEHDDEPSLVENYGHYYRGYELFDENQPRDDHGRWTDGDDHYYRSGTEAEADIGSVLDTGDPEVLRRVEVEDHPNTIHAADEIARVLREMKSAGYTMPNVVKVVRVPSSGPPPDAPSANVAANPPGGLRPRIDEDGRSKYTETVLTVRIPYAMPVNVDLNSAVSAAFDRYDTDGHPLATTRTMRDVIIHEMGHVLHAHERKGISIRDWPMDKDVARKVSTYATENAHEFVAEVFTRLYRGEKLDDDVMWLYRQLQGPKVKAR